MRVIVYGSSGPERFAGFQDFASFIAFLESQFGSNEQQDHESPIGPDDGGYEVDPALATLMSSPEFHKLAESVKAKILQDQHLVEAFAKFLNDGGTFVIDNSFQGAIFNPGPPPVISAEAPILTPGSDYYIIRAVFALAHEIYHNEFRHYPTDGTGTLQQWAYNEAVATLQAYRALERMGLDSQIEGLSMTQEAAVDLIRNSANDAEAMQGLEEHYLNNPPNGF